MAVRELLLELTGEAEISVSIVRVSMIQFVKLTAAGRGGSRSGKGRGQR
jgi:hypothetical protein